MIQGGLNPWRSWRVGAMSQKFIQELQAMTAAEVIGQIPLCPPFLKGEFSPRDSNPSLEKRGRGDFWPERAGNYLANF